MDKNVVWSLWNWVIGKSITRIQFVYKECSGKCLFDFLEYFWFIMW